MLRRPSDASSLVLLKRTCCFGHVTPPRRPMRSLLLPLLHPSIHPLLAGNAADLPFSFHAERTPALSLLPILHTISFCGLTNNTTPPCSNCGLIKGRLPFFIIFTYSRLIWKKKIIVPIFSTFFVLFRKQKPIIIHVFLAAAVAFKTSVFNVLTCLSDCFPP